MWDNLDTPVLTADLDRVEHNIQKVQSYANKHGLRNRPHAKTHKLPFIAHLQMRAGAVGIACQKLGEAEAMAAAGLTDIQIIVPIVGRRKIERVTQLAQEVRLSLVADAVETIRPLSAAFARSGRCVDLYVECDTGWKRTGVQTPSAAAALASIVNDSRGLRFAGLLTYPTPPPTSRWLGEALDLLSARGLAVDVVAGGGTPRIFESHATREITEIRAGAYVFGDRSTIANGVVPYENCALKVLATVVSRPTPDRAIIDVGTKSLTSDARDGSPDALCGTVTNYPEARLFLIEEEHGHIDVSDCTPKPAIGDLVEVIPNSANGSTNMFDTILLHRSGNIVGEFAISARGKAT